jgi:2,3-bisphosphoglycerate-dependent phosphoglycerate mutase
VSDLQCAATLLLAARADADPADGVTLAGRELARDLGHRLAGERVASVYAAPDVAAVQTAELVAGVLGVPVRVRPGLGDALGEELAGIVDLHRGETVLVVCEPASLSEDLPRLLSNVADRYGAGRPLGHCEVAEVAADADGWVLRSWGGRTA